MMRCLFVPPPSPTSYGCPNRATHILMGPRPTACTPVCAVHAREVPHGEVLQQVTWKGYPVEWTVPE